MECGSGFRHDRHIAEIMKKKKERKKKKKKKKKKQKRWGRR